MSTILYTVADLANVILCANAGTPECDARLSLMRTQAQILAAYSVANVAAYRARYEGRHGSDEAVASTAEEIMEWALEPSEDAGDIGNARSFRDLAAYNTDDFETPALTHAIETLCAGF